jgi:hypothetical protein
VQLQFAGVTSDTNVVFAGVEMVITALAALLGPTFVAVTV